MSLGWFRLFREKMRRGEKREREREKLKEMKEKKENFNQLLNLDKRKKSNLLVTEFQKLNF